MNTFHESVEFCDYRLSHSETEKIKETLTKINIHITITPEINIQNMVASGSIGMDLNLNTLAMKLDNTEYEPEQFPGLIHRMVDPKTVILLFASGKLVCTGAKKEAEVYRSVHNLHAILEEKNLIIYDQ